MGFKSKSVLINFIQIMKLFLICVIKIIFEKRIQKRSTSTTTLKTKQA